MILVEDCKRLAKQCKMGDLIEELEIKCKQVYEFGKSSPLHMLTVETWLHFQKDTGANILPKILAYELTTLHCECENCVDVDVAIKVKISFGAVCDKK